MGQVRPPGGPNFGLAAEQGNWFAPKTNIDLIEGYQSGDAIPANKSYFNGQYDVFLYTADGKNLTNVSHFVHSIDYEYDLGTPFATITVVMMNTVELARLLAEPGGWVVFYGPYWNIADDNLVGIDRNHFIDAANNKYVPFNEIDRGQIVDISSSVGGTNMISIRARTLEWLLAKNVLPVRMPEGTLTERLRFMESLGVMQLIDPMIETSHIIAGTRGGRTSIWEDIAFDISETNQVENKRYVLRQRKSRFFLQEISSQAVRWAFEVGNNIFSLQLDQSIQQYYNEVYVLADESSSFISDLTPNPSSSGLSVVGYASASDQFEKFGRHRMTVEKEVDILTSDAQIQAENLLKRFNKITRTAKMFTYSLTGMRPGEQIILYEPLNNISGVYFVGGARHHIESAQAVMELDIEFDFVLPNSIRRAQTEDSLLGDLLPSIPFEASP